MTDPEAVFTPHDLDVMVNLVAHQDAGLFTDQPDILSVIYRCKSLVERAKNGLSANYRILR